MGANKLKEVVFVLAACYSLLSTSFLSAELLNAVPKTAETVYYMRHLDTNQAWDEIIGLYRKSLEKKKDDPNYLMLQYLLRQFTFKEIAGGVVNGKNGTKHILLLNPKLEGDKEKFNRFLIENLGAMVSVDKRWQKKGLAQGDVYFQQEGEANEKLTAFAVVQGQVFLASNSALVEKILSAENKGWNNPVITKSRANYDGFIFVDNSQKKFSNDLKKWETENKIKVLLSADYLKGLSVSFILKSANDMQGRILFLCSDPAKLALVKNDAQFLGEVVRRKFAYAQLGYKSKVLSEGQTVILDFELNNFKSILEKEIQ